MIINHYLLLSTKQYSLVLISPLPIKTKLFTLNILTHSTTKNNQQTNHSITKNNQQTNHSTTKNNQQTNYSTTKNNQQTNYSTTVNLNSILSRYFHLFIHSIISKKQESSYQVPRKRITTIFIRRLQRSVDNCKSIEVNSTRLMNRIITSLMPFTNMKVYLEMSIQNRTISI